MPIRSLYQSVLKSEFALKVQGVLFHQGQYYVDLTVEILVHMCEPGNPTSRFSLLCEEIPCSPQGHLDWSSWLDENPASGVRDQGPALIRHWLEKTKHRRRMLTSTVFDLSKF